MENVWKGHMKSQNIESNRGDFLEGRNRCLSGVLELIAICKEGMARPGGFEPPTL